MFKRLKKLLKRERYIDTLSPAFFNKTKSDSENAFICVVIKIDTDYDTVTLYSFHHDTNITIPMSYEYSINVNDILLIHKIDGIYNIEGKANIDYIRDYRYVYNPDATTLKELLKKESIDISSLKNVDYLQEFYIKKNEGDIVKNIKVTGYRIRDEIVNIFSGVSRFIITLSNIYGLSKNIKFQLFNNTSFKELNETSDGDNAYDISIIKKKNIPYIIDIKGDFLTALSDYKIKIENSPFDISSDVVYCRIIASTDVDNANNIKNRISHQYTNRKNSFSYSTQVGNGINENMIDKLNIYIKEDSLLGKKPLITIDNTSLECKIIYMETITGETYKYCEKSVEINNTIKVEYSDNKIDASDTKTVLWASSLEEYHYPYTTGTYKITKTYANEEINNYAMLAHKKWTYYKDTQLNTYLKYETCDDCNISTLRVEEIPCVKGKYGLVYETYEKMDNTNNMIGKMININKNTDKVTFIMTTDNPFYLSGKIKEKDVSVSLTSDSIIFSGFKNIIYDKVENVIIENSMLTIDKLYVKNSAIFKGSLYASSKNNIVLDAKNIYITGTTFLSKSDNIVLYGTKTATVYSSDDISSSGLFVNPNVISLSGEQISIPGYCRC